MDKKVDTSSMTPEELSKYIEELNKQLLKKKNDEKWSYRDDKEVVLAAAKGGGFFNWEAFEYVSDRLKKDKDVILAVSGNCDSLKYASENLTKDRTFILTAVKKNGCNLRYASEELKNDKEVVLTAIKENGYALRYASEKIKNDKEVVLTAVKKDYSALEYASKDLRNNKEVVLTAVKKYYSALEYASEDLRNNKEFMKIMLSISPKCALYASPNLKKDREIIGPLFLRCIDNVVEENIQYLTEELKNDFDFMCEFASHFFCFNSNSSFNIFDYCGEKLKNDNMFIDIVKIIKKYNSFGCDDEKIKKMISESEYKDDRRFVMKIVSGIFNGLQFVNDKFKNDREIVLAAVKYDSSNLKYLD